MLLPCGGESREKALQRPAGLGRKDHDRRE